MAGSPLFAVLLLVIGGLALYGVGTLLVRSSHASPESVPEREVLLAPETPPDVAIAPSAAIAATPIAPAAVVAAPAPITWTAAVTGSDDQLDVETRIDIIERLALVGEPWCMEVLRDAVQLDPSEEVRATAKAVIIIAR